MINFKSESQLMAELSHVWPLLDCERNHSRQLQARIDELMMEYCPEDMTEDQISNYEKFVAVV